LVNAGQAHLVGVQDEVLTSMTLMNIERDSALAMMRDFNFDAPIED
jgi:hypothetical protein